MFFSLSEASVLNEAYFGKTPGVLRIEKCVRDIRAKYMGDIFTIEANQDPIKYYLQKAIEDEFGFKIVDFEIISSGQLNAFTMPVGYQIDTRPGTYIRATSRGYRYAREAEFATMIAMFTGLMFNDKFTNEEVTAMILHEIGHNFTPGQNFTNSVLQKLRISFNVVTNFLYNPNILTIIVSLFSTSSYGMKINITFNDFINKTVPIIGKGLNIYTSINSFIWYIIFQFFSFMDMIMTIIGGPVGNIMSTINQYAMQPNRLIADTINAGWYVTGLGYTDEQFADSFAAMYGYGPELSTALSKCGIEGGLYKNISSTVMRDIPILNNWFKLSSLPGFLLMTAFDEHPQDAARTMNIIRQLRSDIDDNLSDPRMKKRLKQDLKILESQAKDWQDARMDMDAMIDDPETVNKNWSGFLVNAFGGDITHHIFSRSSGKEVNKSFKDILARTKNIR